VKAKKMLAVIRVWAVNSLRRRPWLGAVIGLGLVVLIWLLGRTLLPGRDATWSRIQETGVWRVGMDPSFPPFEELDVNSGQPVGFDVDLTRAIAAKWGVRAEIVGVGFDQLIDAVAAQRVDSAISALPVFDWRAKEVSFSTPYIEAGIVLATAPDSGITGPKDLAGLRVAVEWGSSGDAQARKQQRLLDGDMELIVRESPDAAMRAVADGEADAVIIDVISLALFDRTGENLAPVGGVLEPDPYVAIVPVDAPDLLDAINEALAALEADGALAELRTRWLSPNMP
jgi:ABC-type amino acid transport substrate-binding protein